MEDLVGCPAFLVHQFRTRHQVSSGGIAESRPEAHSLDLAAVDHTWSTLLRVCTIARLGNGLALQAA